jgi:hypothetical protein
MNSKILIFIFLLASYLKADSQISYTVNINAADVSISSIAAADGDTYSNINIAKLYTSGDTGKPTLPVKYIRLYIPDGKDVDNISFTTSSAITYNLSSEIFPMQKPMPTSTASIVQGFTNPDQTIYSSNSAWPSEMVKLINNGYFDIKNRIVTIAVIPFQYYPLTNKLDFYSSISITVNLKQSTNSPVDSIKNRAPQVQAMYSDILKNMVANPQDIISSTISQKLIPTTTQPLTTPQCSLPVYEYVIITDASLVSGFADFIDWKKRKGIDIGIVTTNDIYSCSGYNTGDIISNPPINDNAGKVRQYLHDAYNTPNGTVWALIAGDYNTNVPVRNNAIYNVPTDSYFAEFTGNWYNNDPLYSPNIFVGRLICANTTDIQNWSNKVLQYEQNPGNGNYSYLLNAFSIQADQMEQGDPPTPPNQAGLVAAHLPMFNHTIWGELPTADATYDIYGYVLPGGTVMGHHKGAEIITKMNEHFGLYSWFCHGGTGGGNSNINVMTSGLDNHALPYWTLDAQDNFNEPNAQQETGNGFDNLYNADYPSILYGISCDVTPFDITSSTGNNGGAMNCGEAFTKLPQTGGITFIGNTRYGIIPDSYLIYESFADLITSDDYHSHLGISEGFSKYNYGNVFLAYSHNLIGCPETEMWTAIPQNLTVTTAPSDLTPNTNNTVAVTISNLPYNKHAMICLYKANDIFVRQDVIGDVNNQATYTFTNVNPTSTGLLNVTVTTHNYIPYQGTIPICTFNSTAWDINSNYSINSVTVVNSNINVNSPATLTINNKLYLKHDATFTVKNGASLVVNTNGAIWDGCNSSTNLIWCGNLIFEGNADVTINSW